MTNPDSIPTPRKPRRWPWILAIALGIPILIAACLIALYIRITPRYMPDAIMTAERFNAAKPGDEITVLVEVTQADPGLTRFHGILLDTSPDGTYLRTTQPVNVYVSLDTVDVLGSIGYQPGAIVQIEGTLETTTPEFTIRVWHHLLVSDQVTLR